MNNALTRRDFFRRIAVVSSALPITATGMVRKPLAKVRLGRVTRESVSVHTQPSDSSRILFQRYRDDVLNLYETIKSESGPAYNPTWHRVWGGYVHSGFIQIVQNRLNPLINEFPSSGQLMEVTVPYSQSYRPRSGGRWERFYRVYYRSTHWVIDSITGPDGRIWYGIGDGLITLTYYIAGEHLRLISQAELDPISPDIPDTEKRMELSINFQTLTAYERQNAVRQFLVSTGDAGLQGAPGTLSTETPRGNFRAESKRPSVHMGDGTIRSDADAYELPGVPWVTYFEKSGGYAIHGTYWHNNFGVTMSHGCVNMSPDDALWIYRWTTPYPDLKKEAEGQRKTPLVIT